MLRYAEYNKILSVIGYQKSWLILLYDERLFNLNKVKDSRIMIRLLLLFSTFASMPVTQVFTRLVIHVHIFKDVQCGKKIAFL